MSVVFYQPLLASGVFELRGDEANHCSRVLRKLPGDIVDIIDGAGYQYEVRLTTVDSRRCAFDVLEKTFREPDPFHIHLAISPTKSSDRMEWMVEKCVEVGLHELTLLQCDHSERSRVRVDRLEKKAISALKQCHRPYALKINKELSRFDDFLDTYISDKPVSCAMGHVSLNHPHMPLKEWQGGSSMIVLIGPEGDFSPHEVEKAGKAGVQLVSLGSNRLRTETAGLIATHTLLLNAD